jgi:protein SCO1/2
MKHYILFVLVFCFSCGSKTKELPILSYKIDASGERKTYAITYDGFTNQLAASFTTDAIKDKIFIANFFFTTCPSICPPMRTQLIAIARQFENSDDFLIVSHTIDPEKDTVPVLRAYAEGTGIANDKWQFLRSSIDETKAQASQYMTNFKPNEAGTDFYHSSYVALVDSNQWIRGFYNILVPEEVQRLKTDIRALINK